MLNTQKDIEDYVYAEVNKILPNFIGNPIDNGMKQYFDYLAKYLENQLAQLIPIVTSPPDIKISVDMYDPTLINIKFTHKPSYPFQYSFTYSYFPVSDENLQTHNIEPSSYASKLFNLKCKTCDYTINKDDSGYFSDIGDFSCDEFIIRDIIE